MGRLLGEYLARSKYLPACLLQPEDSRFNDLCSSKPMTHNHHRELHGWWALVSTLSWL